ncbi:unnamed protein product [Symbiodinium sp. KB8]|nr:unnamed protein product [Symbiodinium sp. KB8]
MEILIAFLRNDKVKTTYILSTAAVAGFLAREDGKRSAAKEGFCCYNDGQEPDLQEHLANACHVICMKVRQEVTNEHALRGAPSGRPSTQWQAGLLCARVLWRALFAAAAAKAPASKRAVPGVFMAACEGLKQGSQKLLTKIWREVQVQFTSKENKYRNMKSRPAWSVIEGHQYEVFGKDRGYGICDPSLVAPSSAGTKPASNLQDYLEEVLALRFAVDWMSLSMEDAQEFLDQATKRAYKRPVVKPKAAPDPVSQQLAALKEKTVDSFSLMWTDDAELRGVASLAIRLMDGLEGPSALTFAATFVGQMLLAMWKGVAPMLAHHAATGAMHLDRIGLAWLLRAAGQTGSCSAGADACTEEQVESVEEQIKNQYLSLLQTFVPPRMDIIGCAGGSVPVKTQCTVNGNGPSCTYKCFSGGQQQLVCGPNEIIHQEHCSGGGCSWGCHAYMSCLKKPELIGCNRMIPATCMWACPGAASKSRLQCPEGVEPGQTLTESKEGINWVC